MTDKPYSVYYMLNESDRLWIKSCCGGTKEEADRYLKILQKNSTMSRLKVIESNENYLENLPGVVEDDKRI